MRLHIFQFVEGAEQAHLDGGVLLGVGERASVGFGPGGDDLVRKENTDRVGQLAVGGDVEDVLVCFGPWASDSLVAERRKTFPDEVVLVNIALRSGVGFEAADGHGSFVVRSSLLAVRDPVRKASSERRIASRRLSWHELDLRLSQTFDRGLGGDGRIINLFESI